MGGAAPMFRCMGDGSLARLEATTLCRVESVSPVMLPFFTMLFLVNIIIFIRPCQAYPPFHRPPARNPRNQPRTLQIVVCPVS